MLLIAALAQGKQCDHKKAPATEGVVTGGYEGCYEKQLFYLYHTITGAQGYEDQKTKKTQKLKPLIMCYN